MARDVHEEYLTAGRTLRMTDVRGTLSGADRAKRPVPSVARSNQDRERRHRERAIAAWLRDLSRS